MSARFARRAGIDEGMARWAGLLHDLGKYSEEFQSLLDHQSGPRPQVEHAGHGAALAAERKAYEIAFAVAGHHAGLPDKGRVSELRERREWGGDRLLLDRAREFQSRAASELPDLGRIPGTLRTKDATDKLALDLRIRLLFSCLLDADRLDAEEAGDPGAQEARANAFGDLNPSDRLERLRKETERLQVEGAGSAASAEVLASRRSVLADCLERGGGPRGTGLFSLTVPTGCGKTLASMAFALRHAAAHGHDRVIVVIPYLSIIEQNAKRLREILGEDVVFEHHSAVPEPEDGGEATGLAYKRRLAAENWQAPVVVTTSVQFFESLFASRPGACRKLHRIARSVVILDEVQTFPPSLLAPTLETVRRLARDYGTTFVFCTATQPALEKHVQPGFAPDPTDCRIEPGEVVEIASEPSRLFQELKRVRVEWPADGETLSWNALADRMAAEGRALAILNTKPQALELFRQLKARKPENVFHLSTLMCPQHRLDVLGRVGRLLKEGAACRVVSTQLVEAGVDLDFPLVLRALGPLDSLAQAAGRCNRGGRLERGTLVVFRPEKASLPHGAYESASQTAEAMIRSGGGRCDLDAPATFRRYFQQFYATQDMDAERIGDLKKELNFPEIAARYRLIDDSTTPVLVPYDEKAREIARSLKVSGVMTRDLARKAQRYLVPLRQRELREALVGTVEPIGESGIYLCLEGRYDAETGIQAGQMDPAGMVV